MSPEDEKYYRNYLDLFVMDGWTQFIEDNKAALERLDPRWSKDWEALVIMRTEMQLRENIDNFEASIRKSFKDLLALDEEGEEEEALLEETI